MKLQSLELKNYKCHAHTLLSDIGSFRCIIGANGTGKTSILEISQFLQGIAKTNGSATEIVTGKVEDNTSKIIQVTLILELSKIEQEKFYSYLNLPDEEQIKTIMKRVRLTFSMKVSKNQKEGIENQILLTGMEISDTGNQTFIEVLSLKDSNKMRVMIASLDTQLLGIGSINNNPYVDEHLRNSIKTETSANGYYIAKPNDSLPYDFVQYLFKFLRYVSASRETNKVVESKRTDDESSITPSGTNVIQFMLTLAFNNPAKFDHISKICKRIFPDIIDIHPFELHDNKFTIAIDKTNSANILLAHEASGLDQLLIILWKIASSPPGTIWFIDEPELHLHPGAQKALYEFLLEQRDEGKQILVGTHSLVFIHKSRLDEITVLTNDEGLSEVVELQILVKAEEDMSRKTEVSAIRDHVFQALGYDPQFGFEAKNIVVVEGKTDEKILQAFASTLNIRLDTSLIIPFGNKGDVERYVPVFAYTLSGKKCLILLDNDRKSPEEMKAKILSKESIYKKNIGAKKTLNESNFYLFHEKVYSIEYYLLEPQAICSAAGVSEIQQKLKRLTN